MAELTTLEEKLAEVLGLAQAAQKATEKVEGLVEDESIAANLQRMREEAEETKGEAAEMMETYLGDEADEKIAELTQWALPIQERHFSDTKECALQVAGGKDPYEEA